MPEKLKGKQCSIITSKFAVSGRILLRHMKKSFWLDKTVVVTGGSKGLGLELTRQFANSGARVFVIARNQALWTEVQAQNALDQVTFAQADVTDAGETKKVISNIVTESGGIDWLVNNVGVSTRIAIESATSEPFLELMKINFASTVNCTQAALASLLERRGGVINIASLAAKTPWRFVGPYVTSKAAVAAYSDQLRFECQGLSTVLAVYPGPIRRDDGGKRYSADTTDLPSGAAEPGAGARLKGLDASLLAKEILQAAERARRELIRPRKAAWLFRLSCLSPRLGDWLRNRFSKS